MFKRLGKKKLMEMIVKLMGKWNGLYELKDRGVWAMGFKKIELI